VSQSLHASAVLVGAHGVLIRGESGSGKSSLALALIDRGARLVADDRLVLSACGESLVATPHGAIAGRIELRGRGLITFPFERGCVIRLVADVVADDALERLPEPHQLTVALLGVTLPRQPVPSTPERGARLILAAIADFPSPSDEGLRTAQV
jgi:serine kinase of HPr protein (carbohydrate metabolism regulator)